MRKIKFSVWCNECVPKVPPKVDGISWGEVYDKCMDLARKDPGYGAKQWIHLCDAVTRGTVSKIEAYDAIALGYVPEHLKVRGSLYAHTI